MAVNSSEYSRLKNLFEEAGQGHVFTFWDTLPESQQAELIANLKGIDPVRCNRIFKQTVHSTDENLTGGKADLQPLPKEAFSSVIELGSKSAEVEKWRLTGLGLIAQNKVGVILLAGGQGTRLGSSQPKGCYDILLPSRKSLFQLQAERIRRLQHLASGIAGAKTPVVIPWYVMTSGPTRLATETFFKQHDYFGMDPCNVVFFEQGVLPAFDSHGRILMETPTTPAVAPDGNGGIYAALRTQGVLSDLSKRGIPYVHAYCVDNCLVKVADPTFIGYCVAKHAEMGCKAVPRRSESEPVGVVCRRDDRYAVVEYSEMDASLAALRRGGELVFRAANIANHFYTADFLAGVCAAAFETQLAYHVAKKKIKHVDLATAQRVAPAAPNGIKLELFIFDVLPHASRVAVLEVPRAEEFSPLKNAPGCADGDSPDTSRADIMQLHAAYLRRAGAIIEKGDDEPVDVVEISPLASYEGEDLHAYSGKVVRTPVHIQASGV
ncbi:hypothetical protein SeMB42_g02234 [Synchytrium endobioticum]|uniref:UDP-N-acetylglucosamine diphosphorylase n=1 Tax=Synchytrium endobioticum TaxID=286115 RepID=A0A507DFK7_9FUNG|nr:hypothetical protein SeMB42_g02234 [Synchytrium endobioticum]TPX50994.1 hypothetical protein SeLEV6574_g00565 [Synchytrium endobioticum]